MPLQATVPRPPRLDRRALRRLSRLLVLLILWTGLSSAGTTPLQLALCHPAQAFPADWDVAGARLSLLNGHNRHVHGLDLGLINRTAQGGIALSLGLWNSAAAEHPTYGAFDRFDRSARCKLHAGLSDSLTGPRPDAAGAGLQLGVFNYADAFSGIQGGGFNTVGTFRGLQLAIGVNETGTSSGIQLALLAGNEVYGDMTGVQLGNLVNICHGTMRGVQYALVNYAHTLHGVQIGVVNIVRDSPVHVLPIINAHF